MEIMYDSARFAFDADLSAMSSNTASYDTYTYELIWTCVVWWAVSRDYEGVVSRGPWLVRDFRTALGTPRMDR
jgi:hypothetical protein